MMGGMMPGMMPFTPMGKPNSWVAGHTLTCSGMPMGMDPVTMSRGMFGNFGNWGMNDMMNMGMMDMTGSGMYGNSGWDGQNMNMMWNGPDKFNSNFASGMSMGSANGAGPNLPTGRGAGPERPGLNALSQPGGPYSHVQNQQRLNEFGPYGARGGLFPGYGPGTPTNSSFPLGPGNANMNAISDGSVQADGQATGGPDLDNRPGSTVAKTANIPRGPAGGGFGVGVAGAPAAPRAMREGRPNVGMRQHPMFSG